MTPPPPQPKIYHITHVDNLASIIVDDCLLSDAALVARGGPPAAIGMAAIKERRLSLSVACRQGTRVGDYVPFFFCPRSFMLYLIYRGNHPDLTYRGGQGPIVHLEADLSAVVAWATTENRRWAFTASNAGARYAHSWCTLHDLNQVDWIAVESKDFRQAEVKEAKQAEFLVHESFPWALVERIGVQSAGVKTQVHLALQSAVHRPLIKVMSDWYY